MADDKVQKLLQGAVKAARQGDKALARKAFLQVLKLDNTNESAWLGLVTVSDDKTEQARILRRLLQMNPDNARAREAARRLGFDLASDQPQAAPAPAATEAETVADAAPSEAIAPPADPDPVPESQSRKRLARLRTDEMQALDDAAVTLDEGDAPASEMPSQPRLSLAEAFARIPQPLPGHEGIPVPEAAKLEAARISANERARQAQDHVQHLGERDVQWVTKQRGRAGERDYALFLAQVGGGIFGVLLVIGLAGLAFAFTRPEFRAVVFVPTPTASPSPTVTPTNTPGSTPTSSPTPRQSPTPTPTLPLTVTPGNPDPNFPPEPTSVYVPIGDVAQPRVAQAAELMELQRYDEAFTILENEREATSASGNFVPYYWLSIWYLEQGDIAAAREIVDEGETVRAGSASIVDYAGLVNTARARIDLFEARQLLQNGDEAAAADLLNSVEAQIQFVVDEVDPRISDAYLVWSDRYVAVGDDQQALSILSQAITSNRSAEIFTDTRLRVEIARIQFRLGNYDEALQELNEVLTLNPFLESALALRVETALAKGDAGLGVLYSQAYLFYHPNSVRAFQLLGDSREAEFKTDQALAAYTQGLAGDADDPAYATILQRRGAIYARQNRLDLAREDLEAALSLRESRDVRRARMLVAFRSGDYDTARADAQRLIDTEEVSVSSPDVAPDSGAAASNALRGTEPAPTAAPEANATPQSPVRSVDRNALIARLTLGRTLVEAGGNLSDARTALELALASDALTREEQAIAFTYLGRIEQARGERTPAIAFYERAIALSPSAERYYLRGQAFEARGDTTGNRRDYEAALRDYDLAQTWAAYQPVAFGDGLRERVQALPDKIDRAQIETTPETTQAAGDD